jgi:hypothetical protein
MAKLQYEVFQRSPQFEQAAAEMRMRPLDWQLLLALDGRARLGDLARLLLVDAEEAADAIAVCERLGLVERRRISLAEGRAEFEIPRAAPKEPAPLIAAEPAPALEADPSAGVAAVKPIEFKLKPAVQVLIR